MNESQLQTAVIDTAHLLGFLVAHFRPAETKKGWRTPVQADGKGFPDLVLVRPPRLLFVELKAKGKKPTPEQEDWLQCLRGVSDYMGQSGKRTAVEVYVWDPSDWQRGLIEEVLR